jgi:hypothetical protein
MAAPFDSGVRIPERRSMEEDDADDAREILIRPIAICDAHWPVSDNRSAILTELATHANCVHISPRTPAKST